MVVKPVSELAEVTIRSINSILQDYGLAWARRTNPPANWRGGFVDFWINGEHSMHRSSGPGGDLLSHALGHSTIGAEGLNGRVRDGNGCGAFAITTRSARPMHIVETF